MKILQDTALTYDDVLLVPQYSDVDSRRKLSTQTKLTREISLQIPIVSANMDVVTESDMAIAMAREGGIGIIHRFLSIDEQARQIQKVKKAESFIVENPIFLTTSHTVGDIKKLVNETGSGGILILDENEKLAGIITTRDLLFEEDAGKSVSALMQRKVITASPEITLKEAEKLLHEHRIEKLPLVDRPGTSQAW
jgi:IMP dehydrogenase